MLINTTRFYERILLGLSSTDPEVVARAQTCLSYLAYKLREKQIVLPPAVAAALKKLPEAPP